MTTCRLLGALQQGRQPPRRRLLEPREELRLDRVGEVRKRSGITNTARTCGIDAATEVAGSDGAVAGAEGEQARRALAEPSNPSFTLERFHQAPETREGGAAATLVSHTRVIAREHRQAAVTAELVVHLVRKLSALGRGGHATAPPPRAPVEFRERLQRERQAALAPAAETTR